MWPILKSLYWIYYNIASVLCFFGPETCVILAPQPGLNPHSLHWKVKSPALDHQGSPIREVWLELVVTVKKPLQQRTLGLGLDIGTGGESYPLEGWCSCASEQKTGWKVVPWPGLVGEMVIDRCYQMGPLNCQEERTAWATLKAGVLKDTSFHGAPEAGCVSQRGLMGTEPKG